MMGVKKDSTVKKAIIAGIGASADGIATLETLMKNLPPEPGMSFVVIQHLAPDTTSILPEILQRKTTLSVEPLKDNTTVKLNHVYVAQPGQFITIQNNVLHSHPMQVEERQVKLPIDHFLRSLAPERQGSSVGVILTGTGSDGTLGVKEIKAEGGMVIVQDPQTATFSSMPHSAIETGVADVICPPEDIARYLVEFAKNLHHHETPFDGETDAQNLKRIFNLLKTHTRHDFSGYKTNTLYRRLRRRMIILKKRTLQEYADHLDQNQQEADMLFREILIGVTSFFRDQESFNTLQNEVIPKLISQAKETIRVWVAACSTGEEAYSIAMLFSQAIREQKAIIQVQIFATDIDRQALETARHGKYRLNIEQDIPKQMLKDYFLKTGNIYQVKKKIRDMVVFAEHSVIKDPPYTRLDLVSCRNFMIYLDGTTQNQVMGTFHYALNSEGYLFLGTSENQSIRNELFTPLDKKTRIFTRKKNIEAAPAYMYRPSKYDFNWRPRDVGQKSPSLKEFAEQIALQEDINPLLVIDAKGDILFSLGPCDNYLQFVQGTPDHNIVSHARNGLKIPMSNAIRRVNQNKEPVEFKMIRVKGATGILHINLRVNPVMRPEEFSHLMIVRLQPLEYSSPESNSPKTRNDLSRYSEDYINQVEHELQETREYLHNVIERLELSNDELKSLNEEAHSSNEELQSTNEQLETSKEEMQSMNEELETSNAELKLKVEEISDINNDLHNFLRSTPIGTLFLDKTLRIRRFTPKVLPLVNLTESDTGRYITDFDIRFDKQLFIDDIRQVLDNRHSIEKEIEAKTGAQYWMSLLPYLDMDDEVEGVVITFTDITEKNRIQQTIKASEKWKKYRQLFEHLEHGLALFDITENGNSNYRVLDVNHAFEELMDMSWETIKPMTFAELFPFLCSQEQLERIREHVTSGKPLREDIFNERLNKYFRILYFSHSEKFMAVLLQDITDIREREIVLTKAHEATEQAARLKSGLLANISHELRTPLNAIIGFTQLLEQSPDPAHVQAIAQSGKQLQHLIDDVIDLSRLETGELPVVMSDFDLNTLMQEVYDQFKGFSLYHKRENIRFTLELPPDEQPIIRTDRKRLSQVLYNLLSNAYKYTDQGWITLAYTLKNSTIEFRVKDSGRGISQELRQRIFGRFEQGENLEGGTGLGLTIVKGLVELLGGTIHLESQPGQGSTFCFTIAYIPGESISQKPETPEYKRMDLSGRNILIAEDDEYSLEMLRLMLKRTGANLLLANDGGKAIELFMQNKHKIDLALLDIRMPVKDGFTVLQEIKNARHQVPVIAQTAHAMPEEIDNFKQKGFDDYIIKPIMMDMLMGKIKRLLS